MPKPPKNETYEQKRMRLMDAGFKVARSRKQNRDENGELKVSDDELWVQAARYADKYLEREGLQTAKRREMAVKEAEEDYDYRKRKEREYRSDYEWNDSNDEASLEHLLNLEIQIRQINRELEDPDRGTVEKEKLRKSLVDITKERRQLESGLGIDRVTRAKHDERGDPMDDWDRIKKEAALKKKMMRDEFTQKATNAQTEAQLRDMIKVGLLLKFDVVDVLLANHRRVLGLDPTVEKS
jgi:hypothetical protein